MSTPTIDAATVQGWLDEYFAPWVHALALRVEHVALGEVVLTLPFAAGLTRSGGTLCGQSLMAAGDTAMALAVGVQLGEFKPMTTVGMTTSFLRPVSGGDARVVARVLKPGRNLVFGEIEVADRDGKLAAHMTTTYALL